ncbi:MAG: hypothetical protein ACRDQD_22935 [Nocardioidaceae bacterium]
MDRIAVAALIRHGSPHVADYVAAARNHPPKPDRVPGPLALPAGTAPEPLSERFRGEVWSRIMRRSS